MGRGWSRVLGHYQEGSRDSVIPVHLGTCVVCIVYFERLGKRMLVSFNILTISSIKYMYLRSCMCLI